MIVITTPTGQIGRQVLGNVLNSGKPIRVIVRDPSRLPSEARKRIDVVQGSHGDSDTVQKAFAGADTVFWLVPPDAKAKSVEAPNPGLRIPARLQPFASGVRSFSNHAYWRTPHRNKGSPTPLRTMQVSTFGAARHGT
jgi:uncharacterized protein YbjT (DUF2867 family)